MTEIDHVIHGVEQLYRSLTGQNAPSGETPYAPIPPERDPVDYVDTQLDRLLSALGPMAAVPQERPYAPPVTLSENAAELCIAVDLPGVPREAVDVSVAQNLLVVSGRRPHGHEGPEWHVAASERPVGPFRRVLPLPAGAALDRLTAEMKHGVLEIRVPRAGGAAPEARVVPVQ